ncbi:triose-phosphate isomerase [Caminibacter mediatlanticus TB-2]|uniref:Triosephosphate isomerase n=1 Tax=Caminibacter mediatlanticus TB-2 TaxID=391592 RepID=A0AAI9F274_9BACT|nr:triose-phosphate isomerase [Caminibacter mediatlanticus]EDM23301.1 triosephosphate isomerase [Caminibacter mediatlanticus TB-2]QCT94225.1 triose-phosphate isomerase [Caminibacter mediatlanticus TB-2]
MIVAANFKMHKTRKETKEYLKKLKSINFEDIKVRVFPPFTALFEDELIGAQNGYPAINGAYTGEIGLEQLKEFNINKILIGHSERRNILNESQEFIAKKFEFFKKENFEIIYCIGEPLEIRKKGIKEVIKYLKTQLIGIDLNYQKLIIAYEPVWAIGTGVSASIEEIKETHYEIRKLTNRPILYGGSVKLNNIEEILKVENVDGVLVGSASLDVKTFKQMIQIAKEIKK